MADPHFRNAGVSVGAVPVTVALLLLPVLMSQLGDMFRELAGPDDTPAPASTESVSAPPTAAPAPEVDTPFDGTAVLYAIVAVVVIAAVGLSIWLSMHAAKRRRARAAEAAALRQKQIDRWNSGVAALAEASDGLWEFEQDPMSVYITRPLLADTSEPASAEFYTAYSDAADLHSETIPADDVAIEAFVAAAKQARDAFDRADQNALRKARLGYTSGGREFTAAEQRKVEQAGKLLNHAFGAGTTQQEAKTAHAKALKLLDGVGVEVPKRLAAKLTLALEQAHWPALADSTVSR